MLICHGSATRYRSEMEMQVSLLIHALKFRPFLYKITKLSDFDYDKIICYSDKISHCSD